MEESNVTQDGKHRGLSIARWQLCEKSTYSTHKRIYTNDNICFGHASSVPTVSQRAFQETSNKHLLHIQKFRPTFEKDVVSHLLRLALVEIRLTSAVAVTG